MINSEPLNSDAEKTKLEQEKLRLEIAGLQAPWWKKPDYLSVIVPIILGFLALVGAWGSGWFDQKREQLMRELQRLRSEIQALKTQKASLGEEVLNALFGEDNWFVFPDHRDGVGVVRLREHFLVIPPVLYIDFGEAQYGRGQTVPGGGAATAKLTGPLTKGVIPAWQHKPLLRWEKTRNATRTSWFKEPAYEFVNPGKLNELLGESNWECDETVDFAIVGRRAKDFAVEYPFTAVDGPDNRKYGVGHTVPAGQSRMWLAGRLASGDCPSPRRPQGAANPGVTPDG